MYRTVQYVCIYNKKVKKYISKSSEIMHSVIILIIIILNNTLTVNALYARAMVEGIKGLDWTMHAVIYLFFSKIHSIFLTHFLVQIPYYI